MALSPGARIGVYEITSLLGEGGMGQVYRATDTALSREVAIKILPDSFASDAERLARFEREARTLASLSHPHIAAVHGFERSGGANALVMELVEGEDLSRLIARGPMPVDEALAIAGQIAEALEAAHEQGIIHRDLKPANIRISPDGTVKVLDFGLAKVVDPAGTSKAEAMNSPTLSIHATAAGMILGTAAYMSPEQARGRATDKRTDIWAFGCVLFEMLSGTRAFDGEDTTEIIAAVVKTTPDWSALPAVLPQRIVALIKKCLEKDRKLRTGDIAVARFVIGDSNTVESTANPAASPKMRARSRIATLVATIASIAVLGLAGPAWIHFREQAPAQKVVRFQVTVPGDRQTANALSPDGKYVAVVARGPSGVQQIWLRALDSLETKPLPGTEGALDPFWSPDSRSIAFGTPGLLRKASIAGGGTQNLCSLTTGFRGGTWSPSGDILFGSPGNGLMRIPESGGTPSPVTVLSADRKESSHQSPWFLPDGRHFVFSRVALSAGLGIWLGSLDTAPEQQPSDPIVTGAYGSAYASSSSTPGGWLLFIQDGTLRAQAFDPERLKTSGDGVPIDTGFLSTPTQRPFSVSGDGVLAHRGGMSNRERRLLWFDRAGKVLGSVGDPGSFNTVALSPDGTRVAVNTAEPGSANDLWIHEFARGSSTRFTFDAGFDWIGTWSPDGRDLVFAADRGGNNDLYRKPASGAVKEELLLGTAAQEYPQDYSPDGSALLYSVNLGSDLDIAILDLKERKTRSYIKSEFYESQPRFSPGGDYVAYTSNASGRYEIYVQPYPDPSAGKWTISVNGGTQPRWRRDGREIFFIGADSQMMAVDVNTTKGFTAGVPKALFHAPVWGGGLTNNVFRYDVIADGQRFLINVDQSDDTPPAVNVVLNWERSLRR